jgi:hypothetical protein
MKKAFSGTIVVLLSIVLITPGAAVSPKNPYGTATIDPAAPNEIILTISKGSQKVEFAYPRLLKLRHSTISIYEPFLKKRQSFTVIRLQTLFNFVGIAGSDKVVTKALNDYIFTAKASDFLKTQGYLAIKRDGAPIPYDQGGPIRIIFPDDSKWSKNLDAWNWSLFTISVK